MNRRKTILILSVILLVVIAIIIYFALTGKKSADIPSNSTGGSTSGGSSSFQTPPDQNTPADTSADATTSTNSNVVVIPRLRHITTVPTSGDTILTRLVDVIKDRVKTKETQYSVRYMDRATGHIFDIKTTSPAAAEISNTTIPKVYEAIFSPDGNSVITRFLSETNPDQILTYSIIMKDKPLSVSATSSNKTVADIGTLSKVGLKDVSGIYLKPDIKELAMSPSGAKLLASYFTSTGGKLVTSSLSGSAEKTVLTHPLRDWLLSFVSENKAVITTKPSGIANGFSYVLDLASGSLKKIVGNIAGLTILPNRDGNTYLGAGTPNGLVKLFAYFAKEDKQTLLPFSTFPEKCVWANTEKYVVYCAVPESIPQTTYPDAWYQGRVSFTDDIWKINVSSGETNLISNLPKESGQKIDGINMKLADDDSYLTFINKLDLTLWGLNLTQRI